VKGSRKSSGTQSSTHASNRIGESANNACMRQRSKSKSGEESKTRDKNDTGDYNGPRESGKVRKEEN
jgi:hypothetical protein